MTKEQFQRAAAFMKAHATSDLTPRPIMDPKKRAEAQQAFSKLMASTKKP